MQRAYETKNLERLETLLALCETTDATVTGATSLYQMRKALQELRKSAQSVQRSLSHARKEMAWNFKLLTDRSKLQARLERQFESDRIMQLDALEDINDLLASWAAEPKPPTPRKPKSRG